MNRQQMTAPFAEEEIRTYDKTWKDKGGREHSLTLTYIEDETVMDRLDAGYGYGNWQVQVEPFPYVDGVVKVRLGVRESAEWVWYEDFGYPNREGGESLKEAVSDGIRRCGRMVGIARDLYRKSTYERPKPAPREHPGLVDGDSRPAPDRPELERRADGLIGVVVKGAEPADLGLRFEPDGTAYWGFKLKAGKVGYQAFATGPLAESLNTATLMSEPTLEGQSVTVWGRIEMVPWRKGDRDMAPYARIIIERMSTPDWTYPAPSETAPLFPDADEEAEILAREMAEANA